MFFSPPTLICEDSSLKFVTFCVSAIDDERSSCNDPVALPIIIEPTCSEMPDLGSLDISTTEAQEVPEVPTDLITDCEVIPTSSTSTSECLNETSTGTVIEIIQSEFVSHGLLVLGHLWLKGNGRN